MALFKLATKLAPQAIRLIKGGAKGKPKTYGTLRKKPDSFKGVESAGAARIPAKPMGGMRTYGGLSKMGKIASNARLFNPMGKTANSRFVGRMGLAGLAGAGIIPAVEKAMGKKPAAPKTSTPKSPIPKGTKKPKANKKKATKTKAARKLKATTTPKATNKSRMKKGVKFGAKYR